MPRNSLYSFSSPEFLSKAWGQMLYDSQKSKRDSFGLDGVSINKFKEDEKRNILRLSQSLRDKSYRPSLLNPHFIPKANGKDRVICVPSVVDRLVQRALLSYLTINGYAFINDVSYGFVRGRSVSMAAKKAVEHRRDLNWVYKADITSFFDRVDRFLLMESVRKNIRLKALHPIIESIVNVEIYCGGSAVSKRIKKLNINEGVGLRQGMPMSPYLANLMLLDFDRSIQSKKVPMVRYADDFVAFSGSEEGCRDIHEYCVGKLSKIGLEVHPIGEENKTIIASPLDTVEFLGLGLVRKADGYAIEVTQKQLDAVKCKVYQYCDLDYCAKNNVNISGLMGKLDGVVSGYLGVYRECSNFEQLKNVLESARNDVMNRLFVSQFGIRYENLTNKQKQFLMLV
ncbi:reverse transcriptase domain-containing protein [Parathalassolituus penaei]|uniref:Reverse transcriptase domain-containing protein n=1 Tax=Parathalassolituus penaei TaxID=2997323 RepID=A0A9X3EG66_9GAMM|nr:reverse transcriptase domain-containing protein [Parathalassolituus penaei]MCY0966630.1 reverse transcriptase domain-containing protein [Parathalassolituus penaei]